MDQQPTSSNKKILAVVGLLVIIAAIGVGIGVSSQRKNADDTVAAQSVSATPSQSAPTAAGTSAATGTSGYKDGTYTATGSYDTPESHETIKVTLTLRGGVVTGSDVSASGNKPDSVQYQGMFASGYKAQVIGKSIDSLQLSRVSGSSLTPMGFNDAVSQIKSQAQS